MLFFLKLIEVFLYSQLVLTKNKKRFDQINTNALSLILRPFKVRDIQNWKRDWNVSGVKSGIVVASWGSTPGSEIYLFAMRWWIIVLEAKRLGAVLLILNYGIVSVSFASVIHSSLLSSLIQSRIIAEAPATCWSVRKAAIERLSRLLECFLYS